MAENKPIESRKTLKFQDKKQICQYTVEFRRLLTELADANALPCEIEIQTVFFRGGCPHS